MRVLELLLSQPPTLHRVLWRHPHLATREWPLRLLLVVAEEKLYNATDEKGKDERMIDGRDEGDMELGWAAGVLRWE